MEKTQQLERKDASAAKDNILPENYQLNHTNTEQQFNAHIVEDIAYNAVDRRMTYHKTQSAYDDQRDQYVEQAFRNYDYEQNKDDNGENASVNKENVAEAFSRSYGASATNLIESKTSVSGEESPSGKGPMTGADKYGISMTAEAPELWKNTAALQKNVELQEKLDNKRKYIQKGYTRLAYYGNEKEWATKPRLQFSYAGKIRLSEEKVELCSFGRLKFEGKVIRTKMTGEDYRNQLQKEERHAFRQRMAGRLLYHKGIALFDNRTVAEDESMATAKRMAKGTAVFAAMGVRRNIRTLKYQDSVYARLELAEQHNRVLNDKRQRLISRSNRKAQKEALREAQSREQKRKLKKQMVQNHAKEEGNFLQRVRHSFMVKKTAREYQRRAVKRTLSTMFSVAGLILFFIIFMMFLLLFTLAATQGGTEYYAAAVTQNDYSTITDATAYFRKLETDMDEYLNADREALEAELETEYGPDIYEFVYDLADFGFHANTLIAYLSALYGEFTLEEVQDELNAVFDEMYTLSIEVKLEDREISKYNPDTGTYDRVIEAKKICYITLEKKELEEVVDARLADELKFQYGAYKLSTGGQQVYAPVMQEDWTDLISSNYGERIHPITKVRTFHKGVDIAVPAGTKLYSAVTGTVTVSKYSESAGNYVTVQTDSGWTVTFMHMDSRAVSVGDRIEQGDFVGLSGNTGNSTGPHLHLQVENEEGNTVNPIFIIPQSCAVIEGKEEMEE